MSDMPEGIGQRPRRSPASWLTGLSAKQWGLGLLVLALVVIALLGGFDRVDPAPLSIKPGDSFDNGALEFTPKRATLMAEVTPRDGSVLRPAPGAELLVVLASVANNGTDPVPLSGPIDLTDIGQAGDPSIFLAFSARVTVQPGRPPTSIVLLTTLANPTTPRGFSRLFGGQRAALSGLSPVNDKHHKLPIGSAGVLIGETNESHPVDDVDHRIIVGDGLMFSQFMVRSAAAGAVVTVDARLREFGDMVNARSGEPMLNWPGATTYFTPHHQVEVVNLNRNYIITPRHGKLPIRLVQPREESRYADALKR